VRKKGKERGDRVNGEKKLGQGDKGVAWPAKPGLCVGGKKKKGCVGVEKHRRRDRRGVGRRGGKNESVKCKCDRRQNDRTPGGGVGGKQS